MAKTPRGKRQRSGPGAVPRRLPMTGWYNPMILSATAIRVAISSVFGQFADKREAIAATNAIEPQPFDTEFDYSDASELWFDFLADTGDGWSSTHAMARLLAAEVLIPKGQSAGLPQGRILFLGGDQVYPTASKQDYADRFLGPFEEAWSPSGAKPHWGEGERHLFAIPGNHDWYDGLNAFFGLFCRRRIKPASAIGFDRPGRIVGGRQTHQTRSYFAVRLPHDWWIWGTDSQLEGYIDQPQIDFFRHVAGNWMSPGSKLILMVGQPSWAYVDEKDPRPVFDNFSYLERLAGMARDENGKPLGHELKLVLTGDSHHYARFSEGERQYITCGGGGAFLHPTLQLKNRTFDWDFPAPGTKWIGRQAYRRSFTIERKADGSEALYPSRGESRRLAFWNLGFAFINWPFTLTLFGVYGLFHWLLDFNARLTGASSLASVLRNKSLVEAMWAYWELVLLTPAAAILISLALGAYYYAADAPHFWKRALIGGGHALAQGLVVTATIAGVMQILPDVPRLYEISIAAAAAAVTSATTYGLYLLTVLLTTGRHWNEAFSSFAHRGFKSMLRMRIAPGGELEVFPIGLTDVPKDSPPSSPRPTLEPHLIEGPIVLR